LLGPRRFIQTTQSFRGAFTQADLNLLRASSDIEAIEEDGIVSTFTTQFNEFFCHNCSILIDLIRTNAPWGLGRVSTHKKLTDQNPAHLTFTYTYDPSAGTGVDIYVIGMYFCNTSICK
jgi:cerevisin